jgi:glucosamine--fructose-6-phosphate aminotransferase (isomerizing)
MAGASTRMGTEAREAAAVLRRQENTLAHPIGELVARLRRKTPQLVVTCARGSSAHAATFGKHLIERHLGIPVSAAAPNIASIYGRQLALRDQLFLAVSQAGRSADIVESAALAKAAGAITAAVVNDADSPLASACDIVLPMQAGPELSVAASKSFIASLVVLLRLTAAWAQDGAMRQGIDHLPERLDDAADLDWSAALASLTGARSVMMIGRGPTLAIAREAALKLKETCNLHAEAFSSAEFQHGPITLVEPAYPVLLFAPADQAAAGIDALRIDLARKGACVFSTESRAPASTFLPTLAPDHPDADAICLIQTFYQLLLRVAARRGHDVDRPRHLQKVTRTR